MQQPCAAGARRTGQVAPGPRPFHAAGGIHLGLGPIHRGVGRRIDDDGRPMRLDRMRHGIGVTDIQVRSRQAYCRHTGRCAGQQASTHLAVCASDEHRPG